MRLLRWLGPLLTVVLVAAAALASLSGPGPVSRLAGSAPFLGLAGLLAVTGAWVGAGCLKRRARRNLAAAAIHLGLALGIAGTAADQAWSRPGYIFVESGAGSHNVFLRQGLRTTDRLTLPVALDSVGTSTARGFRPAPVAYLAGGAGPGPVTYNRPLRLGRLELVFQRTVEPGFLREYELTVADEQYLLLHNQRARLADGRWLWSFAVDPGESSVGFAIGRDTAWLRAGAGRVVDSTRLLLNGYALSSAPGVILAVRDARLRPLLFSGFGLALLGLLLSALRRRPA